MEGISISHNRRPSVVARRPLVKPTKQMVRKVVGHSCKLPVEEDQIHQFINDGIFVLLRRRIRQWLTVSPSSPESIRYFKSSAQIEQEKMRHLSKYFYTIHPFSRGRFVWEVIMIPVFLTLFFLIPMEASVWKSMKERVYAKLIVDLICYVDMVFSFFTGYFDENQQKVELKWSRIVKRYMVRWFLVDFVSSFPVHYILYLKGQTKTNAVVYKGIALLKIPRLNTLTKYIIKLSERFHVSKWHYWIKFATFILTVIISMIWGSCFIFIMTVCRSDLHLNLDKNEEYFYILKHDLGPLAMTAWDAVRAFLRIGVGEIQNLSRYLMFLELVCLICGTVFNIIITANIMQLVQSYSSSNNKYTSLLSEVHEYMKYKALPQHLRDKICSFVDFKFQRHMFKEEEIMRTVSSVLKEEILMHTCQTMVQRVEFFKDLPTPVLLRIVTQMRSEIHLPNDIIVLAGNKGNAMYFIYTGTVAVYTSTGQEICHLEDGDHFGEIALVIAVKRVATVLAVKTCEVFKLNRKDFQEAIDPFPELASKIRTEAMTRLESTMKLLNDQKAEQHVGSVEDASLSEFDTNRSNRSSDEED